MSTENETSHEIIHNKKIYALIAFFWSFVIGIVYSWLFAWKTVGISYVLFFLFFLLSSILPFIVVEKNDGFKRVSFLLSLAITSGILTLSFMYRLNIGWAIWGFLTIPVVNNVLLTASVFPDTIKNFGIFSLIILPFKLFFAWFGDILNFFKNLDFGLVKSHKIKSLVGRFLAGCFAGLFALLIIVPLLSLADQAFAKVFGDVLNTLFGSWFKDFGVTMSNIGKVIVTFGIAGYSSIFLYSLWNGESYLAQLMEGNSKNDILEAKRNWDVIITSVFMFMLNIVFVIFVFVQFKYLFGGESNILSLDSTYSYAQYARRGFSELVFVSLLVYLIVLVLHLKVYTANIIQNIVFRVNYAVMVISILIITYSAFVRLNLLAENYGLTGVRLFGFCVIALIGMLYLMLLVSTFFKTPWKFISISTSMLLLFSYGFSVMAPTDYLIAKANYFRFKNSGQIDIPYLVSLQEEAIPVQIDLVTDADVSLTMQTIVLASLEQKYQGIQESRKDWQSYNVVDQYNKAKLGDIFKDQSSDKYQKVAKEQLSQFLNEYANTMKLGDFSTAYSKYWSKNSKMLDTDMITKMTVTNYEILSVPEFNNWNITNTDLQTDSQYWNGMDIDSKVHYSISESTYNIYDDKGKITGTMKNTQSFCKYETLTVTLEDGQWKLLNASAFTLGNFKDKGNSRANFYQNSDFSNLTYGSTECDDYYGY